MTLEPVVGAVRDTVGGVLSTTATVTLTFGAVAELPAVSVATALSVWPPSEPEDGPS